MKKSALVFLTLLFIVNLTVAQKGKKDVIYLKNGSIIYGQIISSLPSGQVKVKTRDNSLWVFEPSQFDSLSKVNNVLKQIHPGIFNLTEVGILAGSSDNSHNAPFSLINIVGWQCKNRFSMGGGVGVEFFSETYLPVVADFRYSLKRQGASPFFGIQGGYTFALDKPNKLYSNPLINSFPGSTNGNLDLKAKGGLLLNPFVGICTSMNENLSLTFSAGYRIMRHRYKFDDNNSIDLDYNRLSLKIGLIFQ